jgi:hypothetical protein
MIEEAGLYQMGLWAAFSRLSPFGDYRADLRSGLACALFANAHRDPDKHPEPFRPIDFMLFQEKAAVDSSVELGHRIRVALAPMDGGRKGGDLKAWRSARRREVGRAKA